METAEGKREKECEKERCRNRKSDRERTDRD